MKICLSWLLLITIELSHWYFQNKLNARKQSNHTIYEYIFQSTITNRILNSIPNEYTARKRLLTLNLILRTWTVAVEVVEEAVVDEVVENEEVEETEGEKTEMHAEAEEKDEVAEG